jgi:hypothetical protein
MQRRLAKEMAKILGKWHGLMGTSEGNFPGLNMFKHVRTPRIDNFDGKIWRLHLYISWLKPWL